MAGSTSDVDEQAEPHAGDTAPGASGAAGFDAVYRAEWRPLVALAWSLTGSWPSAEELVQDAFTDAFRRWPEVSALDRPGAWVRRAVVNRSASLGRRRSVERRGALRLLARAGTEADGPDADRTADAGMGRVGDPAFWAALRSLPHQQRACLALHYLEERAVDEIAAIVGCSPSTVKVHLHRGRRALADRLDQAASPAPTTATARQEADRDRA